MKKITAVIKPLKLDEVKDKLSELGVGGITVCEVRGTGRQANRPELFRSSMASGGFLPKVCLEMVVTDDMVEPIVEAVVETAGTKKIGDGKIIVTDVESAVRIRTGERGEDAL